MSVVLFCYILDVMLCYVMLCYVMLCVKKKKMLITKKKKVFRRHRQLTSAQNDWGAQHESVFFFPHVTIVCSYTHILSKMITDSE